MAKTRQSKAEQTQNISCIRQTINSFLESPSASGRLRIYILLDTMLEKAMEGEVRAAELLLKYGYGTPVPMQLEEEQAARQIALHIELTPEREY
jgi:hypothetical protein